MTATAFVDAWRRRKSAAFDLAANSTAGRTERVTLFGRALDVYANANLSIYSAQTCNARCPFCVEELRPASRGRELSVQREIEADDGRYFAALDATLEAVRALPPAGPSVSVTGGEPSKDPRLPRILATLARAGARKRTLTTNGSGLLDRTLDGKSRVIDAVAEARLAHLNVSRAHPDDDTNARLMKLPDHLPLEGLRAALTAARAAGVRPRLSLVLLDEGARTLEDVVAYLRFARDRLGVDNVIVRQLMRTDPETVARNAVVRYSDRMRVALEPLLDAISADARFRFVRQIVGYYYYVEVFRFDDTVDVVFEEADLAELERKKRLAPGVIHELIFHPNGRLASTWQPWDGILGP